MNKNFLGGAIINSGDNLPLAAETPLGTLFLKTGSNPGLWYFDFIKDSTPSFGNQSVQDWQKIVDTSGSTYVAKAGDTMTGQLNVQAGVRAAQGDPVSNLSNVGYSFGTDGDTGIFSVGVGNVGTKLSLFINAQERLVVNDGGDVTIDSGIVWHSLNDGIGSGLNADLLDGFDSSLLPVASTVVVRDLNADIAARYVSQTSSNSENPTIAQVMVTNGSDGVVRKSSIAFFTAAVQAAATGNWSINATTANSANSAAVATDLTAGAAGNILYQSAPNVTARLATGASNQVLVSGTTPSWTNTPSLTGTNFSGTAGSLTSGSTNALSATALNASNVWTSIQNFETATAVGGTGSMGDLAAYGGGGNPAGMHFHRVGAYGLNMGLDTDNVFRIGGWSDGAAQYRFTVDNAGNFFARGSLSTNGNVIAYASDARLKKNIQVIPNAVEKVVSLGGYSYDWDMDRCRKAGFKPNAVHEHGLIAQEVEKVLPDAVAAAPFNSDYKTVMYDRVVSLLVAAIAEQQASIEDLKSQVAALKQQ